MGLHMSNLSYESKRVVARVLKADNYHKEYINSFCEFEDPEFVDDLFVKVKGISLSWGEIEDMQISKRRKRECWKIKTTRGYFEFQIIEKPKWIEVPIGMIEPQAKCEEAKGELYLKRMLRNIVNNNVAAILKEIKLDRTELSRNILPWSR